MPSRKRSGSSRRFRFASGIRLPSGRRIGVESPCFVVAELSGNHNRNRAKAAALVRAAKRAGADAVKLQTYTADDLTIDSARPEFTIRGESAWKGRRLYDLYEEAHTPWEWHAELFRLARRLGLAVFSTPFSPRAVDFLERLKCPLYKIASFEIADLELLDAVARTGKPAILSTGMANEAEITEALAVFARRANPRVVLLKCTSAYPAPRSSMNLRAMDRLRERFGVPVGLSDHTLDSRAAAAAAARGAAVLEKHLTLRRADGGPDASFSLEPAEFAATVRAVRETEEALGRAVLGPGAADAANMQFRRSIFAVADIDVGARLTRANVRVIRPGQGLAPKHLPRVLGKKARRPIARGTPIAWKHLHV